MPEKINNFENGENNFDEELKAFLDNLNKNQESIKRESFRKFSKASVLSKIIKEWINKGKIRENDTISYLLNICEREGAEEGFAKTTTQDEWENLQNQIRVIKNQIHWFQNEIIPEDLSIKELLDQLELIIKEEKEFLSKGSNNLNK